MNEYAVEDTHTELEVQEYISDIEKSVPFRYSRIIDAMSLYDGDIGQASNYTGVPYNAFKSRVYNMRKLLKKHNVKSLLLS